MKKQIRIPKTPDTYPCLLIYKTHKSWTNVRFFELNKLWKYVAITIFGFCFEYVWADCFATHKDLITW